MTTFAAAAPTPVNPVGTQGGSGPLDAAYVALDAGIGLAQPLAARSPTVTAAGYILSGHGMPFPTVGHVGNWYIDLDDGALHVRLGTFGIFHVWSDPITFVPSAIYPTLRYYGPGPPDPNVGSAGDYFLQVGLGQGDLAYIGPKTTIGWP